MTQLLFAMKTVGFFASIPCLIILSSILITWDKIVKIVRILEVIKRHSSLSLQFELEKSEVLSRGSWLLLL